MPVALELRTDTEHPDTLTASSECPDIYEETMPGNPPYLLVTINDPETLSVLGKKLATSDADIRILKPQSSRKSADDCFSLPVTAIRVLQIGISPLVSSDGLLNDGDTYGPLMTPFIQSWRDAFHCEHIIKPPSSPPTPMCFPVPKSPCSSNCTRSIYSAKPQLPLAWLKRQENLHQHPFICPVCIEDRIRSQYPRYFEDHQKNPAASQKVTDDVETNVQLWTYEAVLEAVERGGRVCEAEDKAGIFRIKYLEGFKALTQRRNTLVTVWDTRDVRQEIEVEEQNMITPDEDAEMDDLAEQLLDAKIATAQDSAVDDLMEGVSRL
ncbi:uncharacterized protein J4E78_008575 [Alternaria triticimaculans]|uniref:uncharacterized protein n=1 Tax=Alternaria triticimaculans TaxID=297637 RepID=UPI0020C316E6|nr:uncharacterized protein J4E78_008575 [Alternaria triticimaculans]KAI4649057.1 hypothetical protein J4E78_008575 [Alternaria triticimaculans]